MVCKSFKEQHSMDEQLKLCLDCTLHATVHTILGEEIRCRKDGETMFTVFEEFKK